MEYRNIKTGVVISTVDKISGKDWELVKAPNPQPIKEPEVEVDKEAPKKKGKK